MAHQHSSTRIGSINQAEQDLLLLCTYMPLRCLHTQDTQVPCPFFLSRLLLGATLLTWGSLARHQAQGRRAGTEAFVSITHALKTVLISCHALASAKSLAKCFAKIPAPKWKFPCSVLPQMATDLYLWPYRGTHRAPRP